MKLSFNKKLSDGRNRAKKRPASLNPNLPFEDSDPSSTDVKESSETILNVDAGGSSEETVAMDEDGEKKKKVAEEYQVQGNKLAEDGKYREALGKWETAITLMPERATLHEQKAQVLLELGEAWNALKAATRATELDSTWAEAWITLGRAQLNFGEPDSAIESFDKALALKPDSHEAKEDRKTASNLIKRRKQLHTTESRFLVGD